MLGNVDILLIKIRKLGDGDPIGIGEGVVSPLYLQAIAIGLTNGKGKSSNVIFFIIFI